MLQSIVRLCRPAPPPAVVARAAARPLHEGLTSAEYLQLIRARVDARQAEELDIRIAMVRVEEGRARLARMRADMHERETIRSSRFVVTEKKGK